MLALYVRKANIVRIGHGRADAAQLQPAGHVMRADCVPNTGVNVLLRAEAPPENFAESLDALRTIGELVDLSVPNEQAAPAGEKQRDAETRPRLHSGLEKRAPKRRALHRSQRRARAQPVRRPSGHYQPYQ